MTNAVTVIWHSFILESRAVPLQQASMSHAAIRDTHSIKKQVYVILTAPILSSIDHIQNDATSMPM